jgi:hypothetical protein
MTPLNNIVTSFGALTELWMIAYKGFLGQGLTDADAMKHTKEFMESTLKVIVGLGGK